VYQDATNPQFVKKKMRDAALTWSHSSLTGVHPAPSLPVLVQIRQSVWVPTEVER
jgi:hypothetical protein